MTELKHYDLLIQKLDAFVRKYYVNKLIKGLLLTIGLVGIVFLIFSLGENFFYFGQTGRKVLFYSFLGLTGFSLYRWVITPILHYFQLGRVISHEQAASIIGTHFVDVQDKLLNILQLRKQLEQDPNASLLLAGIEQKTEAIRPIAFPNAIDLSRNRTYLKYALPPLAILLFLLIAAPSMIREPATRILANNKDFAKPAPFTFILQDEDLQVAQYGDYELQVETKGNVLPSEVFITIGEFQYRLQKSPEGTFSYTFNNVNKPVDFQLFSGNVFSPEYKLNVLLKPSISRFEVVLDYPDYTGRRDETLSNIGDLLLPQGTRVTWLFNAENTDTVSIRFGDITSLEEIVKRQGNQEFLFSKRAVSDQRYTVFISNQYLPHADSIGYSLTVVPDLHPVIQVQPFVDSLENNVVFFAGDASDDYGLSQLIFHTRITRENGKEEAPVTTAVSIAKGKDTRFDHAMDIPSLGLAPGDQVSYYFEVWDNDAINGRKSSRSQVMQYAKPSAEALDEKEKMNNEQIKDNLKKALEESKKIQKDLQKLSEKLLQEKNLDWQQRKEMEKLLNRRKELQEEIQKSKDLFDQNMREQEEFSKPSPELKEKQEKLQKMFEEMLSEEMKEMLKQMEEMLQQLDKEKSLEKLEEMKMDEEELSKELDRMEEMFKELEVEKDIQEQLDKLNELAKEQEDLAEKTENKDLPQDELKKEQEELNKKFDEVQEKMEDIQKRNEELESPKELGDPEEKMEEIDKDMEDSSDEIEKGQNGKASKSQKSAAQKMKDAAKAMEMNMQGGEEEQMEEDMKALRQLLENLVTLSFEQENLIADVGKTSEAAPRYVQLVQVQKKLQDDFKLVEDSLHALSKRNMQIESFITEKVTEIKGNMKRSVNDLEERQKNTAAVDQQFSMKNLNDLALMLSEVMNQMQQQMANMKAGDQNCKKPGGNKPNGGKPSDKMGQGQKSLNQIMKDMQERMKNGKGGSSKEFAQMAAKQAAMRKALEELAKDKRQGGKGDKELQDIIDQMNKTEIDLVNKRLNSETMKRQEDILKRLLDHEKAERERDQEEKRRSETATQYERKMPPNLEEYLKKREAELELYRTVSPNLKPYYKNLVEEYHRNLKNTR